jgi:hypothetical protein
MYQGDPAGENPTLGSVDAQSNGILQVSDQARTQALNSDARLSEVRGGYCRCSSCNMNTVAPGLLGAIQRRIGASQERFHCDVFHCFRQADDSRAECD